MRLPTENQCLDYFKEYHVPNNIFEHCLNVRNLAMFIAERFVEKGISVNLDLVNCLALLHDLFKVVAFKELKPNQFHNYSFSEDEILMWKNLREKFPGMYEDAVAYEVFKDEFPEMAFNLKEISNHHSKDRSWEEIIVHYADLRVFKNKVVTLAERLEYLTQIYLKDAESWRKDVEQVKLFENKIVEQIGLSPEEIAMAVER
jgi:hypothetical protein